LDVTSVTGDIAGVAAAYCGLGWTTAAVAGQREAIAEIRRVGGDVTVDNNIHDRPVIAVRLSGSDVSDGTLKWLSGFKMLRSLDLSWANVTDMGSSMLRA